MGVCFPPVVALTAQDCHVPREEAHHRSDTLREDAGAIKAVIGMDGVLSSWLSTHQALVLVTFDAGNLEEGVQAVSLLLVGPFLRDGSGASQFLFWRLVRLGRADVDAAQGTFFQFVPADLGGFLFYDLIVLFTPPLVYNSDHR